MRYDRFTLRDLLIHGGPHEVAPQSLAWVVSHARRYAADPTVSRAQRQRIEQTWLDAEPHEPEAEQVAAEWAFDEEDPR